MATTIEISRAISADEVVDPILAIARLLVDTAVDEAVKDTLDVINDVTLPTPLEYNDADYFPITVNVTVDDT